MSRHELGSGIHMLLASRSSLPCAAIRRSSVLALAVAAACDLGGGGGGGPAAEPLPPRPLPAPAPVPADGAGRGAMLFHEQGCPLCHAEAGKGGVENPNSETGGRINGLTLVKEGYTRDQLEARLRGGVPEVGRQDRRGPTPPLRMLAYGRYLTAAQISDLADYVLSLYPKDRVAKDDWDDDASATAKTRGGGK